MKSKLPFPMEVNEMLLPSRLVKARHVKARHYKANGRQGKCNQTLATWFQHVRMSLGNRVALAPPFFFNIVKPPLRVFAGATLSLFRSAEEFKDFERFRGKMNPRCAHCRPLVVYKILENHLLVVILLIHKAVLLCLHWCQISRVRQPPALLPVVDQRPSFSNQLIALQTHAVHFGPFSAS